MNSVIQPVSNEDPRFESYIESICDGTELVREELQRMLIVIVKMNYIVSGSYKEARELVAEAKAAYAEAHEHLIGIDHGLNAPVLKAYARGEMKDGNGDEGSLTTDEEKSPIDVAVDYYAASRRWSDAAIADARNGRLGYEPHALRPMQWAEVLDEASGIEDAERQKRRLHLIRTSLPRQVHRDLTNELLDAAAEE